MREAQRGIAALAALFLVVGVSVAGVRLQPTPVDVDLAVDRFRAEAPLEPTAVAAPMTAPSEPGTDADDGTPTDGTAEEADAPAEPAGDASTSATDGVADGEAAPRREDRAAEASARPAPPEPGLARRPDAGVYTYDTDGYHEVEVLRSRSRHDYPATTSLTMRHTDCGLEGRWDVLDERWETVASCVADRSSILRELTIYHEFYGRGERRSYTCDDTTVLYPAAEQVGERWTGRCASDDTVIDIAATVVERSEVTVEGHPVEALHVRFTSTFRGDLEGRQQLDRWLEVGTGLELRATAHLDVTGGSGVDRFRLQERYERVLTSREPRR